MHIHKIFYIKTFKIAPKCFDPKILFVYKIQFLLYYFENLILLYWFVLLTQHCAGDKIEKNETGWACGAYGWGKGVCRVLVGKPEGRRPLGRPRRRWVYNIRMDIKEVGCGYMDWIGLAQDRDRWRSFECGNERSGSVKCGELLD